MTEAHEFDLSRNTVGRHLIINIDDIELTNPYLANNNTVLSMCDLFLKLSNATVIKSFCHVFDPQGFSAVYLLSESHFSIHTWPETGKIRMDLFTCGDNIKLKYGMDYIRNCYQNASIYTDTIVR